MFIQFSVVEFCVRDVFLKVKGKVHPRKGTETLYRPYSP